MKSSFLCFVFALHCFFSASALGYDKHQGEFPPAKEVYAKSIVLISAKGTAEWNKLVPNLGRKDFDKLKVIRSFSREGMGVVFSLARHQYIITSAHVIMPTKLMDGEDQVKLERLIHCEVRATDYYAQYAPCPVTIAQVNEEYDLALLKVPEEWIAFKPLSTPVGSLSRLEPNDALSGILKRRRGETPFGHGKAEMDRSKIRTDAQRFTMSMKIREGDSGSPIFAYENEKPVFLGIVTAYLEDQQRDFYISIGTGVASLITSAQKKGPALVFLQQTENGARRVREVQR